MFNVPIFRQKNSDSDGRCLVGTVTSVDVDKSRAQAYASITASYIANYNYCTIAISHVVVAKQLAPTGIFYP